MDIKLMIVMAILFVINICTLSEVAKAVNENFYLALNYFSLLILCIIFLRPIKKRKAVRRKDL